MVDNQNKPSQNPSTPPEESELYKRMMLVSDIAEQYNVQHLDLPGKIEEIKKEEVLMAAYNDKREEFFYTDC